MAKTKRASWYAISMRVPGQSAVAARFVVHKTADPEIKHGRYAFGPYRTKVKACQVAMYQGYGRVPKACVGVNVPRDEVS